MHHNQFNNTPSLTGDGSWFHYFNSVMAEHVMASHDTSPHPKRGPEWYLQLEKLQDMSFWIILISCQKRKPWKQLAEDNQNIHFVKSTHEKDSFFNKIIAYLTLEIIIKNQKCYCTHHTVWT